MVHDQVATWQPHYLLKEKKYNYQTLPDKLKIKGHKTSHDAHNFYLFYYKVC